MFENEAGTFATVGYHAVLLEPIKGELGGFYLRRGTNRQR
jgi:hypothetical protein